VKNFRILPAIAALAVSATLLTGCSAISQIAQGQTKVQACVTIDANLTAVGKKLSSMSTELQADPKGAAKQIATLASKFATASSKIKNPQVKKASVTAAHTLTTFSKDITAIAANPTADAATALTADTTKLQTAFTKIDTVCKP
jgi:hypothetical protein